MVTHYTYSYPKISLMEPNLSRCCVCVCFVRKPCIRPLVSRRSWSRCKVSSGYTYLFCLINVGGGGGGGAGKEVALDSYTLPLFSDVGFFFSTDFAREPLLCILLFSNSQIKFQIHHFIWHPGFSSALNLCICISDCCRWHYTQRWPVKFLSHNVGLYSRVK